MADKKSKKRLQDDYVNFYKELLTKSEGFKQQRKKTSIEEEIAERERIKNKGLNQDIDLKKVTLFVLFGFLAVETIAVFTIAFFQGFKFYEFQIEEWSFKLLIVATITQISYMLRFAVKHLFPNK